MAVGYTPVYKIVKGGVDISDKFNDRTTTIEIEIKSGDGNPDTCTIVVDDRDWAVAAVEAGVKIEVYLGYKEIGYAQQGVFEVNTVDYDINPRQIKIVGNSVGFQGALKAPAIKNFENKTLGEIIGEIAGKGKVSAYVSPDLASEKIPMLNQTGSPLHLLGELERRFGAVAKFENEKLVFVNRDEGETVSGLSTATLVLKPQHLQKGFVRHSQRTEYASAKVGWMDPKTHIKKYVEEQNNDVADGIDAIFMSGKLGRTESEAKAMVKSQMESLKRSMGEAHLTLSKGDPWIRAQMKTVVAGFRDKIDGSYIIDTVTHSYTKDAGIVTEILAKPPGTGEDFATSLDEKDFYKLGSGGVVGDLGPQLPTGEIGQGEPEATDNTITVTAPEPPVNV